MSSACLLRAPFYGRHFGISPIQPGRHSSSLPASISNHSAAESAALAKISARLSGPFRPSLAAGEIRERIGSFPKRCDGGRDLMKRVVAGPLQDLGTPGAASIERAVPVAGNLDKIAGDNLVIAAEGMMQFVALAAAARSACIHSRGRAASSRSGRHFPHWRRLSVRPHAAFASGS